tara:strand:- start:686 stop:1021 length:336 start_codon:yes stop_codon:yes gene_type:complete
MKIVKNNSTPAVSTTYNKDPFGLFNIFPKINNNVPIKYGNVLLSCIILRNSYKQNSIKIKNKLTKVILLYSIENIRTLTKTSPDTARFKSFPINYKSSKSSKYKFFEFVFP